MGSKSSSIHTNTDSGQMVKASQSEGCIVHAFDSQVSFERMSLSIRAAVVFSPFHVTLLFVLYIVQKSK